MALLSFGYDTKYINFLMSQTQKSNIEKEILNLFSGEQIIRGVQPIVTDKYVNEHIPSGMRATIMSYKTLMVTFTAMISQLIFGMLVDNFGIFDASRIIVLFGVYQAGVPKRLITLPLLLILKNL